MSVYEVSELQTINYDAEGVDEVLQNVRFILSLVKDSCVMDREIGWLQDALDAPIGFAQSQIAFRIIEEIETRESRAKVEDVTFERDDLNGRLIPTVKVVILDAAL